MYIVCQITCIILSFADLLYKGSKCLLKFRFQSILGFELGGGGWKIKGLICLTPLKTIFKWLWIANVSTVKNNIHVHVLTVIYNKQYFKYPMKLSKNSIQKFGWAFKMKYDVVAGDPTLTYRWCGSSKNFGRWC